MPSQRGSPRSQGGLVRRLVGGSIRPRAVLALLLGGSLGGVWIAHLEDPPVFRIGWWAAVVLLGTLAGGLYWRTRLFDPSAFDDATEAEAVRAHWDRVESVAGLGLAGLAVIGLGLGAVNPLGGPAEGLLAASLISLPLLHPTTRLRSRHARSGRTALLRRGRVGVVLLALALLAWLETGPGTIDWVVRLGHLGSFAIWVGGAIWHNVVILPAVGSIPSLARPLRSQARRFRRRLPVVIVVLLLTGAYQTVRLLGASARVLAETSVGRVVALKLLVLALLSGLVVLTVWRARPTTRSAGGTAGGPPP